MGYSQDVWCNATVLSPNRVEAGALVGFPVTDKPSALQAARELLAVGPQAIVVKLGSEGALLVSADQELYVPALPVTVVDMIGAGDAFTAALTLALAEGQPMEQAVRFASAAGAASTTRYGTSASMPSRDEVDELLKG
jgi:ribokinase